MGDCVVARRDHVLSGAGGLAKRTVNGTHDMFKQYLMPDRLLIRFGALLGMVFLVLVSAWSLSYLFLPEGILRGRTAAQALAGDDLAGGSLWLEWLRLLAINLGIMLVVMIAPNILRTEGDYPLGYHTVTLVAAVFGVTLGTNSFALSLGGKLPPMCLRRPPLSRSRNIVSWGGGQSKRRT